MIGIRRLKCRNCGAYHRELPDFLAPYKHYETEVISGVLDEVVSADDMEDNCPCDSTVASWHHWLMINELRIDGYPCSNTYEVPVKTGWRLFFALSIIQAGFWCPPGLMGMHRLLYDGTKDP